MKRPALWFTLSFATGILLQKQTGNFLIPFLCCVAMAGLFFMGKKKGISFVFVIFMGALWLMIRDPLANPELHGKSFEGEGEIIQVLSYKEGKTRAVLRSSRLNGENYRGKFYFITKIQVEPGDRVRFRGDFYLPEGQRNPFGFEQDSYLKSLGVKGSLCSDEITMLSEKGWRSYGVRGIYKSYEKLKPVTADFLSRVVLGYGEAEEEDLRQLGLSHVLAASGLHLGVLSAFLIVFFQFIGLSKSFASYFTLVLLWLYGTLIGFPISLVRSLVMFSLLILALPLQKAYDHITAWVVAAGVSLIYNPWWLFRTGFLLSYGATGSLLILYPEIRARFLSKYPSLAVYCAVQLGLFPLQMSFFNQWNPWSLMANLFFLPFFIVAFILSFLLLPFGKIPIVGDFIAFIVDLGTTIFLSLTQWAGGLPGHIHGASWSFPMILFYFALLATFFYLSREKIGLKGNFCRWALTSWCFLFACSSLSALFPPMTVRFFGYGPRGCDFDFRTASCDD